MGTNGRLNNRQIALRGMVMKEKKKLGSMKRTDKWYELGQLPMCNTQLLEYNPLEILMKTFVMSICNTT
jgi:hypothetical protein